MKIEDKAALLEVRLWISQRETATANHRLASQHAAQFQAQAAALNEKAAAAVGKLLADAGVSMETHEINLETGEITERTKSAVA